LSYSPTRADATPVATDAVARLNTSPSPNAGASLKDTLVALMDSILCASGVQVENNITLSANNTNAGSFVDMPGTSFTFTAPIAKTYTVHCDLAFFFSVGTSGTGYGAVRLVVNGSNGAEVVAGASSLNNLIPLHTMHSAACLVGANTIKLQWAVFGTTTINTNTTAYANYIVSG